MSQATLFLMLGYPGAGKTTTAKIIHDLTGAEHIWADHERRRMFSHPTHNHSENLKLYNHLNKVAEQLLAEGKSVIYDTNFNFFADREHMRQIAAKYKAQTKLIWVQTDKAVARERALHPDHAVRNTYTEAMPLEDFERMAQHLKAPLSNEKSLLIEGTNITPTKIKKLLEIA